MVTKRGANYLLIDSAGALTSFLKRIASQPLVAVDTEAASFHRFVDRTYLVQLSTRDETAIIDPLKVDDFQELGAVIADPAVEVIFHDADYDLRILNRDYKIRARHLFDTRIAAQLLGEPAIGLAALLEKYLHVKVDKKYQRADWSRRPLTPEMLDYAAMDTRHLPELRDELRRQLEEKGRLSWAEEEFKHLEDLRWTPIQTNGDSYLRIKGARLLSRRGLALLRELAHWRDEVAAELDRATFRVMPNEALLLMAGTPPASLDAMKALPGVSPRLVEQRGDALLGALAKGLEVPEKELPRFPRGERRVQDAAFDARVDKLKSTRNKAAERLKLDPGVLCPKGALEAVARAKPKTMAEMRAVPDMRKWQAEELGKEFLAALES
ncbi:MAG TPA: ribonuclease D [Gemmatimonadales bacterium]